MRLKAPKRVTWWIALIVGAVGVAVHVLPIPGLAWLSAVDFWLVVVAFVLLILATALKGF